VSRSAIAGACEERLLTFEVGRSLYALPIAGVIEVAEVGRLACIPSLPPHIGGVVNYRGDALPVLRRASLLDVDEAALPEPAHLLVVTDRVTGGTCFGLPVDRIVGLVDGAAAAACGTHPIAERRPIDGRVANVLDPKRLVARARDAIERSLVRSE
jgi:chemotaxis signal transduction protein